MPQQSTQSGPGDRSDPTVLRVAVPNKGSLSQPAVEMLREAGYRQRVDAKRLTLRKVRRGYEPDGS